MLSQKARYALRATIYLARTEGSATVADISASEGIPLKFLEQIMTTMRARGIVASKRGPTGGFTLARPADRISFAEILRCIDGPLALAPCASLTAPGVCPDCKTLETCEIRPILLAVRTTTSLLLEGMSLAEAVGRNDISFV